MVIDWIVLGTMMAGLAAVFGPLVAWKHKNDWDKIRSLKADSDQKIAHYMELSRQMKDDSNSKIAALDAKITDVYTITAAKLDKQDHQLALARIDKEIGDLRNDAKQGQTEIRQDIKDLRSDLMAAIKDSR